MLYRVTVYKLFMLRIVTWSYDCLLRIIVIPHNPNYQPLL